MIELTAGDGHKLAAYRAEPKGKPRAGLIVVQEIFGVNSHIRSVADGYAADGYLAIAPAFFDRVEPGLDIGYAQADIERGRAFIPKMQWDKVMLDAGAAFGLFYLSQSPSPGTTTNDISVTELSTGLQYNALGGSLFSPVYSTDIVTGLPRNNRSWNLNQKVTLSYVTGSHGFKLGVVYVPTEESEGLPVANHLIGLSRSERADVADRTLWTR